MGSASWRIALAAMSVASLSLTSACEDGSTDVTTPNPAETPDLRGQAFRLTIDMRSGRIDVTQPAPSTRTAAGGLSLSLLGREAIRLTAGDCAFGPAPNSKLKRCTFDLSLTNKLESADLVTPSSLPQPPAGTSGLLVFPYTSASLGVGGGTATPTPDWDKGPINFFNDFGGCVAGKTSDCYRYELYPGPLAAGATTAARRVGFDVNKAAQSVTVYVVVAADIGQSVTLNNSLSCGTLVLANDQYGSSNVNITLGRIDEFTWRGFCEFALDPVAGKRVASAVLRLYQIAVSSGLGTDNPYGLGPVLADHVRWTPPVLAPASDLFNASGAVSLLAPNIGSISTDATEGVYKELDVTASVSDDVVQGRAASQFRFRFANDDVDPRPGSGIATFGTGVGDPQPAELVVTYTNP